MTEAAQPRLDRIPAPDKKKIIKKNNLFQIRFGNAGSTLHADLDVDSAFKEKTKDSDPGFLMTKI